MRIILASPEAKVWSARKHIPLGLGYLAAVLREGGHEVIIYDAAIEDVGVDYYLDLAEAEGRPYRADRRHRHHAADSRSVGDGAALPRSAA